MRYRGSSVGSVEKRSQVVPCGPASQQTVGLQQDAISHSVLL
ncbi:Uncharacterised protein [Vibrio cholerae]|nr:Uncharacterised protein [Vibrio cholerae]CSI05045.1 Uncharacterised protein [Vibrio cholerae]